MILVRLYRSLGTSDVARLTSGHFELPPFAYNTAMTLGRPTRSAMGVLFIALTLIGWSSVPLFLKHFSSSINAWTANGWRYGISALFWLPVLLAAMHRGRVHSNLWKAAIVPSIVNILGQNCFAWAPYYIMPGMMTFILRFNIVFIVIGAYLLFPAERGILRSPGYWVGLVLVLIGSIGVIFSGERAPSGSSVIGIVLAVFGGFFFAMYSLAVRRYMHGFHPVTAFAAISLYTSIVLVLMMIPLAGRSSLAVLSFSAGQVGLLIASSLMGIALGHAFYYAALARLGVSISSGVVLLQPVLASIGSFFLFDERLTPWQWISGLGALGGAVLLVRTQERKRDTVRVESDAPQGTPAAIGVVPE